KGTSDLFYLDVSSPFYSANPKWTDLTSVAPIPVTSAFAPSCVGGSNSSTIFLFEHRRTNNANSTSLVTFTFDTSSQKWTAPTMSGVIPPPRQDMRAVADKNGKIYITGGFEPYTTFRSYNSTYILDSLSLSWTNGANALIIRSAYTATLLPSGDIVYVGGTNDDGSVSILNAKFDLLTAPNNNIYILDTSNYTWVSSIVSVSTTAPPGANGIPSGASGTSSSNTTQKDSDQSNNHLPLNILLIAGVGGLLGALIVIGSIIGIIYNRKKSHDDKYIPTPGTNIPY
ncbi:17676_t:CDS:2, partial [Racocetra fulgida]